MLDTKVTKKTVVERYAGLQQQIIDEDIKLSDIADYVLNKIVGVYLKKAWFVFMNSAVYKNRIQLLTNLLDAVETSIAENSDKSLIQAIDLSDSSYVQPRLLARLIDQGFINAAKGKLPVRIDKASNGEAVELKGGLTQCVSHLEQEVKLVGKLALSSDEKILTVKLIHANKQLKNQFLELQKAYTLSLQALDKTQNDLLVMKDWVVKNFQLKDPVDSPETKVTSLLISS